MLEKIERLQKILDESENTVFFGGAGVSTESGIPDFRSSEGIYQRQQLLRPENIISRSFFDAHPEEFYAFYKKNMLYLNAQPNPAHIALAKMEKVGKLAAVVTQNIDGLHQKAGSTQVYELHGTVHDNYCMRCHEHYTAEYVKESTGIPRCHCGGVIKPKVTLYEEALPEGVFEKAAQLVAKAQTLIVGGTSLVVYPAAGLLQYFKGDHLVILNKGDTGKEGQASLVIHAPIGEVFSALQI